MGLLSRVHYHLRCKKTLPILMERVFLIIIYTQPRKRDASATFLIPTI